MVVALSLLTGCAARGELRPARIPVSVPDEHSSLTPQPVTRPYTTQLGGGTAGPQTSKGRLIMMRRLFLKSLTPLAVAFSTLTAAPVTADQQVEARRKDQPIVRRRAPSGQRHNALAFVRTELFFGTAKPIGAVTEEEFNKFLDEVVTPLFPDGLTVIKADGQFKGEDGVTIKEQSFVLVLLYPVDGQKASSRSIDFIRAEYMQQHQQESVLRVDDPFLVWVSF